MLNRQRMIDNLLDMIKINSESLHEKDMVDFMEKYFRDRNLEIYRDDVGEKFGSNGSNLLVHINGTIEAAEKVEGICFAAHMDTVEPGKNIVPVIDMERGIMHSGNSTILAADDKAGIAAILEAVAYTRENDIPHRDIDILLTVCEEIGMQGVKHFDWSKISTKNVIAVDACGDAGVIAYGAPAKDDIKVKFVGLKAHAGIEPEKGLNAIYMAADSIANMKLGRVDEITTSNIGRIEGGGQTNIVTDEVTFTAEVRSHDLKTLDSEVAKIKKACEDAANKFGGQVEFNVTRDYPVLKLNKDSFIFKHSVKSYEDEGIEPKPVVIGGGSDANILAGQGFDCAIVSCGMNKVHTVEETLDIEELYKTANVLFRMITK